MNEETSPASYQIKHCQHEAQVHRRKTVVVRNNRTGELKVVCTLHLPHYTLNEWTTERGYI